MTSRPFSRAVTWSSSPRERVEALRLADDVLRQGVQGICDLVTVPGLINLDLADVRTIMTDAGTAHMGIGMAQGEGRAEKATEVAINSSLLETSIQGARGILLNISGGEDLSLFEVNQVAELINHAADVEANIIFGAVVDDSLQEMLRVTVGATGFSGLSGEDTGRRPRMERRPRRVELPYLPPERAQRKGKRRTTTRVRKVTWISHRFSSASRMMMPDHPVAVHLQLR